MPWFSAAQPVPQASAVHNSLPATSVHSYIFHGVYLTTLPRVQNIGLVREWRIIQYVAWSGTDSASQIPDICLEGLRKPRSTLSRTNRDLNPAPTEHQAGTKRPRRLVTTTERQGSIWYGVRIRWQTASNWFVSSLHGRRSTYHAFSMCEIPRGRKCLAGLSPRRIGLSTRPDNVVFMVHKVAMRQVFSLSISPLLYQHNSTNAPCTSSFIYHRRYMSLAADSVAIYDTQIKIQHRVTALWKANMCM